MNQSTSQGPVYWTEVADLEISSGNMSDSGKFEPRDSGTNSGTNPKTLVVKVLCGLFEAKSFTRQYKFVPGTGTNFPESDMFPH